MCAKVQEKLKKPIRDVEEIFQRPKLLKMKTISETKITVNQLNGTLTIEDKNISKLIYQQQPSKMKQRKKIQNQNKT